MKFLHDLELGGMGCALFIVAIAFAIGLKFFGAWFWALFIIGFLTFFGITGGPAIYRFLDARWGDGDNS